MINILKHLEVYGITTEMNFFKTIMVLLLIFPLIIITVLHLNLKQKQHAEQEITFKIRVPLKNLIDF